TSVSLVRSATEGALDDVSGAILELLKGAHGRATDVRSFTRTFIPEEAGANDLETATTSIDGSATIVGFFVLRVPVDEGQVLPGEAGVILVVAMAGRLPLLFATGVPVEDPRLAAAAQRHLAAAVEDN